MRFSSEAATGKTMEPRQEQGLRYVASATSHQVFSSVTFNEVYAPFWQQMLVGRVGHEFLRERHDRVPEEFLKAGATPMPSKAGAAPMPSKSETTPTEQTDATDPFRGHGYTGAPRGVPALRAGLRSS